MKISQIFVFLFFADFVWNILKNIFEADKKNGFGGIVFMGLVMLYYFSVGKEIAW